MVRILFVIMFIAVSCSSSDKVQIRDLSKDFPTTIELQGEVMNIPSDSLDDCLYFDIIGNYGVVCGQYGSRILTTIDLNNGSINKSLTKGRGPGEFTNFNVLVSDSLYYLMQISPTMYHNTSDYYELCDCGDGLISKYGSFVVSDSLYTTPSVLFSSSNLIYDLSSSTPYYDGSMRCAVYDNSGELMDSIGNILDLKECYVNDLEFNLANFGGWYSKLRGVDCFVFCPFRGAYLEFYDCSDYLNKSMERVVYSIPKMDVEVMEGGFSARPTPDCIVGFTDIASSAENYYCLYVGITQEEAVARRYNNSSPDVYLYSATGKPLDHYKLDRDVKNIAVTPNGEYLYAWSPNEETLEPQIVRYTLP